MKLQRSLSAAILIAMTTGRAAPSGGTVDTAFDSQGGTPSGAILSLAISADRHLYVGGSFTGYASSDRAGMVRLEPNGDVDPQFAPPSLTRVMAIANLGASEVLVGGLFQLPGSPDFTGVAKLSSTGVVDPTFKPNFAKSSSLQFLLPPIVTALAVESTGDVLVGGSFTLGTWNLSNCELRSQPPDNYHYRNFARLKPNGDLDRTLDHVLVGICFNAGVGVESDGFVRSIQLGPEGQITLAGSFIHRATGREGVLQMSRSGSINEGLLPRLMYYDPFGRTSARVGSMSMNVNGQIAISGEYEDTLGGIQVGVSRPMNTCTWFSSDLTQATELWCAITPKGARARKVEQVRFDAAGGLLVASGNVLYRFGPDHQLDPTFQCVLAPESAVITALEFDGDERLYLAGTFTSVNEVPRAGLARIFTGLSPIGPLVRADAVGGHVRLHFQTNPGNSYSLETTDSLPATAWTEKARIVGNGTWVDVHDLNDGDLGPRFYRVRRD